jgi:Sulfatase
MKATALGSLRRLLRTTCVVVVAAFIVGLFDATSVLGRGGSPAMIPLTVALLSAAAVAGGVLFWMAAELSTRLGALVGRTLRARGLSGPDPLEWPAFIAILGLAAAVFPMHRVVERALGHVRVTGYILFPTLVAVATFRVTGLVRRVYERSTSRTRLVGVAGAASAVAFGIHYANAQLYSGLYPEIHRPMSVAVLVVVILGLAGLGASLPIRSIASTLGALLAVSLMLMPFMGSPVRAHAPVAFFGTELLHFHEGIEALLDRDGDGYSSSLGGGDCDDDDAAVNPSRIEVADNGRDDNCLRGDMKTRPRPAPHVPPPDDGVAAWRTDHPHPNVLLLFIDTLRADRLGALGLHRGLTPNLDALAAKSVVFDQARTTAPRTPHALMALLRGRFNSRILEGRNRIADPGRDTLVFGLRENGYTTFARLVGSEWPDFHLGSGWDHLEMRSDVYEVTGAAVTFTAKEWLASVPSPFFMMLHYADPHAPYFEHAENPSGPSMADRYDGEVAFTDAQIGPVLDDLSGRGLLESTIVVAFGDHGENLGDHGDAGGNHGVSLFEEVIRIPIILYVPGATPSRVSVPVSIADLGPTLLDLVDGQALGDPDGCSLAGYAFGRAPAPEYTISEFYDFGHLLRAIVKGRYKLVVDVRHNAWMLFDILEDPEEHHDLADSRADVVRDLRDTLDTWIEERADTNVAPNTRCAR